MEAYGACGIAAIVLAAACGVALGLILDGAWRRRNAAASALAPNRRERVLLRISKGIEPFRPLAAKIVGIPSIKKVAEESVELLEGRDIPTTPQALISLMLVVVAGVGVLAGLITMSVVCGVAVSCLCVVALSVYVRNRFEKRSLAMREQIPDALRCMGVCFRSGLSLSQTLQQTAKECSGALGKLFGVAARRLQMGASVEEALSVMRSSDHVPELSFVAVALDVQHQSGGSIAPVLETARESVVNELDLMRSLRVQTAQARLSASIVTVMPFVLVAIFSLVSPGFLTPFFTSLAGMGLLAVALIMQLVGVLTVRHMLQIGRG
ncbi:MULTISPECIES: type II secretion system F family protein [unclassified Adlercreutzia]|uniref:type II secretion system F family protein n=1 Tax=unclassified Adlercreutzia TaxID=2636013 RepID=UPI0013EB2B0C|nr:MULTISPECIES: type II secretion system F family protein [unclassified Adlercreutzia]